MPYRAPAEFSWQSTDQYVHARRVVAAIVLVAVGWSTGFFAGRMSAWLFPVTNSDTAAVESYVAPRRRPGGADDGCTSGAAAGGADHHHSLNAACG